MATRPHRQVCPLCALDDDDLVGWEVEGPGLWRFTCTNPSHGAYSWLTTGRNALETSGHEGLSAELGIDDDLLACFHPSERLIEYGVVEYRYAQHNPAAYRHLVGLYSHTALERPLDYSASAFIGAAIGKLGRKGLLEHLPCKATGYWRYNGTLSAWGLTPSNGIDRLPITWELFADTAGLDPEVWPIERLLTGGG